MSPKDEYKLLCDQQDDIPLFMQHWYLCCVCAGKQWDVWLWHDAEGRAVAAMPYLYRKRLGVRFVVQPTHCQSGGIWLSSDVAHDADIVARITQQAVAFLKSLKLWYYYQLYIADSPMVPQMEQQGFKLRKRVTYRIEDLAHTGMAEVEQRCSKNKRRQFQKAQNLTLHDDLDAEDFYNFHRQTLAARNRQISYTREYFLVLHHKAVERGQGRILSLTDDDGQVLAAAFVVWDKTTLYYLIPAFDIKHKDSGASARIALEAIRLAKSMGLVFDFEGSIIKGVAKHYKQYGTTPQYYYSVERTYNIIFRLLWLAYRLVNRKKIGTNILTNK